MAPFRFLPGILIVSAISIARVFQKLGRVLKIKSQSSKEREVMYQKELFLALICILISEIINGVASGC